MRVVGVDCETEAIRAGALAPPLVCVSVCDAGDVQLFHRTEARLVVERLLRDRTALLVGHNFAFDWSVFASEWPELIPEIFDAYAMDRITCTSIREKLLHIARGTYRWITIGGERKRFEYGLDEVADLRLGVVMDGFWQMKFGELRDVPIASWPQGAKDYALFDPLVTVAIYEDQEPDAYFLEDQFRQARAAWWIQLMACWGLITDPVAVEEFARSIQKKYDALAEELARAGLVRRDRRTGLPSTRNDLAARARVEAVYTAAGKKVPRTKKKEKPLSDDDTCSRSGDALLEKYADLSSLTKKLSTDIPLLRDAKQAPLKINWEVLVETGRTSTRRNVQNIPTEVGMRECFTPRLGWVYAVGDYSLFECHTWSQVCLRVFGKSRMAEALVGGGEFEGAGPQDVHTQIACRILHIPYEEAYADYKTNPKGRVYFPRQCGKVANYGLPGGLGETTFLEYSRKNYNTIITPDEAHDVNTAWRDSWPEHGPWFEWIGSITMDPHPVVKQFCSNRYRGEVHFTNAANGFFQGLAADAAKNAGFLISRACYADANSPLYGCRIVNFPHDEFVVEVPDDRYAHERAVELGHLMEVGALPFVPDVPVKAEPMLTRRWSKKAKPVYENGRLVPWDFPGGRIAA